MAMRWWKKHKPRVFLGSISVYERIDFKRHLEQQGLGESEPLDEALRRALTEIFSLPSAASAADVSSTDLALDVWVPRFQSGEVVNIGLGDDSIALLWRPKVTVASRLYFLSTRKTKAAFQVTEKMQWRHFLGRAFSWRALLGRQSFAREDLELLLFQACAKLLTKMQRAI